MRSDDLHIDLSPTCVHVCMRGCARMYVHVHVAGREGAEDAEEAAGGGRRAEEAADRGGNEEAACQGGGAEEAAGQGGAGITARTHVGMQTAPMTAHRNSCMYMHLDVQTHALCTHMHACMHMCI